MVSEVEMNESILMKQKILGFLLVFASAFFVTAEMSQTYAAPCNAPTTGVNATFPGYDVTTSHTITIDLSQNFDDSYNRRLTAEDGLFVDKAQSPWFPIDQNISNSCNNDGCVSVQDGLVTWEITAPGALTASGGTGASDSYYVDLVSPIGTIGDNQCDVGTYYAQAIDGPGSGCTIEVVQDRNGQSCYQNPAQNACFANNLPITVNVSGLKSSGGDPWEDIVGLRITQSGVAGEWDGGGATASNGSATLSFTPSANGSTEYLIFIEERRWFNQDFPNCSFTINTENGCNSDQCEEDPQNVIDPGQAQSIGPDEFKLCAQIADPEAQQKCIDCAGGEDGEAGVWTAIGCINRQPEAIVGKLIRLGLSMGGGIALLMILSAGFMLTVSQGNPQKAGQAKEMMTAAVTGLLFIIFSVTILQFIGFSILKIPGFGGP